MIQLLKRSNMIFTLYLCVREISVFLKCFALTYNTDCCSQEKPRKGCTFSMQLLIKRYATIYFSILIISQCQWIYFQLSYIYIYIYSLCFCFFGRVKLTCVFGISSLAFKYKCTKISKLSRSFKFLIFLNNLDCS